MDSQFQKGYLNFGEGLLFRCDGSNLYLSLDSYYFQKQIILGIQFLRVLQYMVWMIELFEFFRFSFGYIENQRVVQISFLDIYLNENENVFVFN